MKQALIALCAAPFASCAAVGPEYVAPSAPALAAWSAPVAPVAAEHVEPLVLERWWSAFGDAQLDALIDRAGPGNLDLAVATERVREARAALGVARS